MIIYMLKQLFMYHVHTSTLGLGWSKLLVSMVTSLKYICIGVSVTTDLGDIIFELQVSLHNVRLAS